VHNNNNSNINNNRRGCTHSWDADISGFGVY